MTSTIPASVEFEIDVFTMLLEMLTSKSFQKKDVEERLRISRHVRQLLQRV